MTAFAGAPILPLHTLTVAGTRIHRWPMTPARRAPLTSWGMSAGPANPTAQEVELIGAGRGGEEGAYQRLVEPHRGELHAHCYRMLGSVHDAEDALQEALLRAWRALPKFEGRSSLRSWLYRIATNTSLDAIEKRPKRVL